MYIYISIWLCVGCCAGEEGLKENVCVCEREREVEEERMFDVCYIYVREREREREGACVSESE
jgi:hypothetical protein